MTTDVIRDGVLDTAVTTAWLLQADGSVGTPSAKGITVAISEREDRLKETMQNHWPNSFYHFRHTGCLSQRMLRSMRVT